MAPPPRAYAGAYAASCVCDALFCCAVGPKGVFARGPHLTLSAQWHKDVGIIIASTLMIQTLTACGLWAVPLCVHRLKRRLKMKAVSPALPPPPSRALPSCPMQRAEISPRSRNKCARVECARVE